AWDRNRSHVLGAITEARAAGVSVLCLPELCLTGYGCEDAFHGKGVLDTALTMLVEIAPETRGMIVSVGLPVLHRKAVFNTAALLCDGRVLGLVGKRFLAGDGIHYEPRWFKAWPAGGKGTIELPGGAQVPIGDLHFDCGGVRLGFEICEDAWVARRPGGVLSLRGVDVILNPSASHFAFGKHEVRRRFVLEGSRAFGVTYVYSNLVGNEAGRIVYDGGALIASAGAMAAEGPRFTFRPCLVTSAVVDVDLPRMKRAATMSAETDVDETDEHPVSAPFAFPALAPDEVRPIHAAPAAWETSPDRKHEELTRAISLGLFGYAQKSRSAGFVVSMSGGADSAACATLVRTMTELATAELGMAAFRERFAHVPALARADTLDAMTRTLLLTAYQATENSGPVTRAAARAVSESLGAEHHELDVGPMLHGYLETIEKAIGRKLDWKTDDITLQNVQARVRAPSIWMFANLRNALLLCTSNRSEAAVGYTTMDGDTAGGLCPIAGIDKAYLRTWLRWMETTGPLGLHAFPALAAVNAQQPTAELRPPGAKQTDEDDLMPYPLLDAIERLAIRDKRAPLEVFQIVKHENPSYAPSQLAMWVERFFKLWCRNQWKRERFAPSFHLDDENLDPKTWCRFPILSGGFDRELAELRAHVRML
ncbi:MAG: NAD(+) synthase, partial [Deltaproteobacteria bacterium]|nr:NAD(+) synthase [Deltaproteobacteria bacterium]